LTSIALILNTNKRLFAIATNTHVQVAKVITTNFSTRGCVIFNIDSTIYTLTLLALNAHPLCLISEVDINLGSNIKYTYVKLKIFSFLEFQSSMNK
jgi:hypothetical protein